MATDFTGNDPNRFQDVQATPADYGIGVNGASATDSPLPAATMRAYAQLASAPAPSPVDHSDPSYWDTNNEITRHNKAVGMAANAAQLAQHIFNMQHEAMQNSQGAEFLHRLTGLSPQDPQYEKKLVGMYAELPYAAGHKAVDDAVNKLGAVRNIQLQLTRKGGESAYEQDSPEQQAYVQAFKASGGDAATAHASAGRVMEGEKRLDQYKANGLITKDDFPEWDGQPTTKPAQYNQDGSLNYHVIDQIASAKAAQVSGKSFRADRQEATDARSDLSAATAALKALPEEDPRRAQFESLRDNAAATLLKHSQGNPASQSAPVSSFIIKPKKP